MQKKEVTIINNGGHDMEVKDGGEKITKVEKAHVGPWTVVQKLRRFCWNTTVEKSSIMFSKNTHMHTRRQILQTSRLKETTDLGM